MTTENSFAKIEITELPDDYTPESIIAFAARCAGVEGFDSEDVIPPRIKEMLPCVVEGIDAINEIDFNDGRLSGFFKNGMYHTSARELEAWGWSFQEILDALSFSHWHTLKVTAPKHIYESVSRIGTVRTFRHFAQEVNGEGRETITFSLGGWTNDRHGLPCLFGTDFKEDLCSGEEIKEKAQFTQMLESILS